MRKKHKNMLTVIGNPERRGRRTFVRCKCECGGECVLRADHVRLKGHCGCLTEYNLGVGMRTHGLCRIREYGIWSQMRSRCSNPNNVGYPFYGAKGIRVCDEWINSFQSFIDHIGLAPSKKHTLDRIDSAKNYEPGNVRWATRAQQARNTSRNVFVTANNQTMTIADWSDVTGIAYHVIAYRVRNGWDHNRAVSEPVSQKHSFKKDRKGYLRPDGVFVKDQSCQ